MRSLLFTKTLTLLIANSLVLSPLMFAQAVPEQQTRPRRVHTISSSDPPAPPEFNEIKTTRLSGEPTLRIGLATNARSVTISTTGRLLNATDTKAPPTPLTVARVRIEPRILTPLPPPSESELFRIEVAALTSRAMAESTARDIRDLTGDQPEILQDAATGAWRIRLTTASRGEAEERRARLEDAGFATVLLNEAGSGRPSTRSASSPPLSIASDKSSSIKRSPKASDVRLVSRVSLPTRGLVVYASGVSPLLDAREPVTFTTDDEQNTPVRFNEKPYRGRIEIFANTRGTLTVVNVIGLEDYVRGVVPNELSPGGYPALEALKAQAVAARTYAVANHGQFAAEGYDLLPTTRSQVYGGMATEHPLTTRAVQETSGVIVTHNGEPINALYTSTCGGRTEHAENIFGGKAVPYLRGRECMAEGAHPFAPFTIKTSREPATLREAEHVSSARAAALLTIYGFKLPSRLTDDWLSSPLTLEDARNLSEGVARLARRSVPVVSNDATRPPGFSTLLTMALDGESRGDVLLDQADVSYHLDIRDADEIPARNRADVALFLRDGHLVLYPDATLRPRQAMSRARALYTTAHLLESRGLLILQKATARPSSNGSLIIRPGKGPDRVLNMSADAYLFRAFGDNLYGMRAVTLVGGEPVAYHTDSRGVVDYLEVRPAPNGAAADHFSPFTNWTVMMTPAEARGRLARYAGSTGSLVDLRVAARGSSRRVLDLEIIGTNGTAHLRGGRIRSAMGLREQLFVIDRRYDEMGRLTGFVFTGRGWGHGVGMCQVGAYGLARAGLSYERILKAYYTGITLAKLY